MELIDRPRYVDKVAGYLGKGLMVALTGQRRVGKSCVLRCVMRRMAAHGADTHVVYINKEFAEFAALQTAEQLSAYVEAHIKPGLRNCLFVDEVQDIDGFEKALRDLHARECCDIVITGSNAKMLSGELATYLAGRYVEVHIQSLDYREFLQFHALSDTEEAFLQYLSYGGLPQLAHLGLDNTFLVSDYLRDVYNTVIMKDVISREKIRNVRFLADLARFVADNVGKNFSAHSVSRFMRSQGITVTPTLTANYLAFFCNAYVVRQTRRFDIHGRRLFDTNEKYYFEDIGLRNVLVGVNLRGDIEKLLENVVYLHLCASGYEVTVGQLQNGEVDFVAVRGNARLYVQVCYLLATQETVEREFGSLRAIRDDYPKMVVCMDRLAAAGSYEGIACVHVRDFLLADA